jgi:DNA-directed RNA polymerase specialized sigma subunit
MVLILRYHEDLSEVEIANVMDLDEADVAVLHDAAMDVIRASVQPSSSSHLKVRN